MLIHNLSELLPTLLASSKALQATAGKCQLKPAQVRVLLALFVVCKSWPGQVTPGELQALGLLSPTLLREYVRVLVVGGFVERSRNPHGRQVLWPTSKGQQAVKQYLADLHRLSRSFALPTE